VSRGGAEAVAAALEGCDGKVVAVGRNLEPLRAVLEAGERVLQMPHFSAASLFGFALRAYAEPCRTGLARWSPITGRVSVRVVRDLCYIDRTRGACALGNEFWVVDFLLN